MSGRVQWILASGSPRRRELLTHIQPDFRVISPDVEEWNPETADPIHQAEENATRKGKAVGALHPESLVIASDTTVALGRSIFGKPATHEDAVRMLEKLSGKEHLVVTGVALLFKGQTHIFSEASDVHFRVLDRDRIEEYLRRVHVLDKAGAYGIQEQGDLIIENYQGSFENIMGLPIQRLRKELVQLAWVDLPELEA